MRIEDETAPAVPDDFEKTVSVPLDSDLLTEHLNLSSSVFFAGVTSPDYLMLGP